MFTFEDIEAGAQTFTDPMTQVSFYDCVLRSNNAPATCQFIPESTFSDGFMAECMAYNDIPLPYFLKAYGFSRKEYPGQGSYLLMLTDPVEFNLAFDLQKRMAEGRRYSEEEIKIIVKTCIEGVAVLWKSSQLTNRGHGNLTPSSVFMTKEGTYKLGSFNSALAFKKEKTPYACYLHPRAGKNTMNIVEADLFAIGMLIYQLSVLDNKAVPNLNTAKQNIRAQWRNFHYTENRLEEIWFELIETNKTSSSTERIIKLSNILESFSQSAVTPQITSNAPFLSNPQPVHPVHSHSNSYPAQAVTPSPAVETQKLTSSQTSSVHPPQVPYPAPLHAFNPVSQSYIQPDPYQPPQQPPQQYADFQPSRSMGVDPTRYACENCKAVQLVSENAAGFICRVCLHVSRVALA